MTIDKFCEYAKTFITERGIFPAPGLLNKANGKCDVLALILQPDDILDFAYTNWLNCETIEQIISLDFYAKPNTGTELDSVLIIFYFRRNEPVMLGVMEYSWNDSNPIIKPVNWENAFWKKVFGEILDSFSCLTIINMAMTKEFFA